MRDEQRERKGLDNAGGIGIPVVEPTRFKSRVSKLVLRKTKQKTLVLRLISTTCSVKSPTSIGVVFHRASIAPTGGPHDERVTS